MRSRIFASFGLEKIAALVVVVFAIYCRIIHPDITWFNTHMARDFVRSLEWIHFHPSSWLGPEMNSGVRLYGPAYYWLIGLVWALVHSLPALLVALHLITIVLSLWFCLILAKDLGNEFAWIFFLQFFLMPVPVLVSRTLWNPSMIVATSLAILILARNCSNPSKLNAKIIGVFLVGWFGLQVHHSTLVPLVSAVVVIFWTTRRKMAIRASSAFLAAYMLIMRTLANPRGLSSGFSIPSLAYLYAKTMHFPQYLCDWNYHLFLTDQPIRHYELFPLIFNLGAVVDPSAFHVLGIFVTVIRAIYLTIFYVCSLYLMYVLVDKLRKRVPFDFYEKIVVVWTTLAILSLFLFLEKKEPLPYRYGLMWYPIQFLVIPLAIRHFQSLPSVSRWPWVPVVLRNGAIGFCAVIFAGNAFYLLKSYRVMAATGRISHVVSDTVEIPLRDKLEIIQMVRTERNTPAIYKTLHGPIANKMLAMDVDMDEKEYYGALVSAISKTPPVASAGPKQDYYLDSYTLGEMRANYEQKEPVLPFHFIKLEKEDLPFDIKGEYLDEKGGSLANRNFKPDEMILPLDTEDLRPRKFDLSFRISRKGNGFVRICFDEGRGFTSLELDEIWVDGSPAKYRANHSEWLEQREAIVSLANVQSEEPLVRIKFRVIRRNARLSRIDIFKTASGLFRYENDPLAEGRSLVWE